MYESVYTDAYMMYRKMVNRVPTILKSFKTNNKKKKKYLFVSEWQNIQEPADDFTAALDAYRNVEKYVVFLRD